VSFVDADGAKVVAALAERGAVIVGASALVSEILRAAARPDGSPTAADADRDDGDGDGELLARLRRGDESAFDELTRRHAARMLAVARRMLRSEEDARDAVQEAFLQAFKSLDGFHGNARLSTWLHRIVVNAGLMRLRTRKRKPEHAIDDLLPQFDETGHFSREVEPIELPDGALERRELRTTVRRCIDLLPEPYRAVIVLRDIEELDGDETAAALGLTVSAVKSRLHRARQALRTLLQQSRLGADVPAAETTRDPEGRPASHDRA
jgi:RNA polymerase sigma-70 factor (ECF subfamily)